MINGQDHVKTRATVLAISAAALYGLSSPLSKLLLKGLSPAFMAAFLYLGAGFGMLLVTIVKHQFTGRRTKEAALTREEMPFILLMILLDILAPILLMYGLGMTTAANASLLNNFEIVATTLLALFLFREAVGRRMWLAIGLITLSSVLLTIEDPGSLRFSGGSVLVLLACVAWGLENNTTRKLSIKDPMQVVIIKGLGSGLGALIIAVLAREMKFDLGYAFLTLLLGFAAYGISIYFYIMAQRDLGASRTSAYYATAPFIGVIISFALFRTPMTTTFVLASIIMLLGTYFVITESHGHVHEHAVETHEHKHSHDDLHHDHQHEPPFSGEHSHIHEHEKLIHDHEHLPDLHHRHEHSK